LADLTLLFNPFSGELGGVFLLLLMVGTGEEQGDVCEETEAKDDDDIVL